jgi:NMD protein affecting ribosome stability and mRNA decay
MNKNKIKNPNKPLLEDDPMKQNYRIGYCMKCGKYVKRLADYRVIGLCDDCFKQGEKALQEFFKLYRGFTVCK